jgi:hypothetical protein
MVGIPRPGAPTIQPTAPWNSTSEEAFERLPSLSFRRCTRIALRLPSGRKRGTKKQLSPALPASSTCARIRWASDCGTEKNHLWPTMRQAPSPSAPKRSLASPGSIGSARVVLARTSLPPCFSVMPMPTSAPRFCDTGSERGSYSFDRIFGSQAAASAGTRRRAGTEAKVIVTGHWAPFSTWPNSRYCAARATWAPGRASTQGAEWAPDRIRRDIKRCQAGWNSTSSIRLPMRS